jgi:DNA polymerase IV
VKRSILHVDLDAFYASVEQRDDPALRGKPVVVGGHEKRGVVCAASYEARPFGVKSAMPMSEALRLCPKAIVIKPRMHHYATVSSQFFAILDRYSPLVEGLSLDEAFLDVTGEERLLGDGPTIARTIKDRVREQLALVASVGVAPSKFVAKIASDLGKPDGLVTVPDGGERAFLHPLPVSRLWGVGKVTEAELHQLNIRTIGDVSRLGYDVLSLRMTPDQARHLCNLSDGVDDRDVVSDRAPISVGHEDTFDRDIFKRDELARHLLDQADRVCARLRDLNLRCRVVTLKIKYSDHRRTSRRATLDRPTSDNRVLGKTVIGLLAGVPEIDRRGVRLTGVSASDLRGKDSSRQLLFDEPSAEKGEALGAALDKIAGKFGRSAIKRADLLDETSAITTGGVPLPRRKR